MSINLEKMSLPELIELQKKLKPAIKKKQKKAKTSVRKQMEELAKQSGFTFDEVISTASPKKVSKVKPKYANPNDADQTWTGRGRRPKWVEAELKDGKSLDDFLI
ncbi:MAG TPA: H-NS histone family protein [Leucothrix mucor]|uniref:H-NS histone family protein n=1 Tax=Leucothrix mucor TaxID=45248 RepID=A0A7V2WU66_LEUMU|nr:H-NS histone family protein [Leucothrix mucor]